MAYEPIDFPLLETYACGGMITNCLKCIWRPQVDDPGSSTMTSGWARCTKGVDVQYWTGPQITMSGNGIKHLSIVRNGSDCPLYDDGVYTGPRPTRFERILRDVSIL